MKKYNTKPIDYTGCHPVIAEHLKRGEEIRCWVWDQDSHDKPTHCSNEEWVVRYWAAAGYPYRTASDTFFRHAEPITLKTRRIMPPERAIPVLIAEGWRFNEYGNLVCQGEEISGSAFRYFGFPRDTPGADARSWPPCIVEEVEDEE